MLVLMYFDNITRLHYLIIKQIFTCYVCDIEEAVTTEYTQWSFQLSFYFVFHNWGNHAKMFFLEEKFLFFHFQLSYK